MTKIQQAISGTNLNTPPIWIMRQAGRHLPEYVDLRKKEPDFIKFCQNKELVVEATMQPINRYDLDAAIIFSDILVIPSALGQKVEFIEHKGPVLGPIPAVGEAFFDINHINPTYEAIETVRKRLPEEKSLIGFSGAPWTLFCYMMGGGSKNEFLPAKKAAYEDSEHINATIELLTNCIIEHLSKQIEAGCDVVQIFDSWAGILPSAEFEKFVIKPTNKIYNSIKKKHPEVKIICFPRGSGYLYHKLIKVVRPDVIGLDQYFPMSQIKDLQKYLCVQGNLDPISLLVDNKDVISKKVDAILSMVDKSKFIFNLGHGILPETPIENVVHLIKCIRK